MKKNLDLRQHKMRRRNKGKKNQLRSISAQCQWATTINRSETSCTSKFYFRHPHYIIKCPIRQGGAGGKVLIGL